MSVRLLGPVRHPLADAVGLAWWLAHPPDRRQAARNHSRAGGGLDASTARRRARTSFREYARMLADGVWVNRMSPQRLLSLCELRGREHLEAVRRGHQGAVIAMCHFGNWDLAAGVAMALGLPVTTVMAPVGPPAVSGLIAWERARKGLELFTPRQAARGLVRAVREGRFVGLLVDIPEGGPTIEVPFCRGPVQFSAVPAWLAETTGAAILPVECWRSAGSRYQVRIHAPLVPARGAAPGETMSQLAGVLEEAVLSHPEQWYPFHRVYADDIPDSHGHSDHGGVITSPQSAATPGAGPNVQLRA